MEEMQKVVFDDESDFENRTYRDCRDDGQRARGNG